MHISFVNPFLEELKKKVESGNAKKFISVFLFIAIISLSLGVYFQQDPEGFAFKPAEKAMPACVKVNDLLNKGYSDSVIAEKFIQAYDQKKICKEDLEKAAAFANSHQS
jgi:hypothetical protein